MFFQAKKNFFGSFPDIKQKTFGLLAKIVWQGCQMHSKYPEEHFDKKKQLCQKGWFFSFSEIGLQTLALLAKIFWQVVKCILRVQKNILTNKCFYKKGRFLFHFRKVSYKLSGFWRKKKAGLSEQQSLYPRNNLRKTGWTRKLYFLLSFPHLQRLSIMFSVKKTRRELSWLHALCPVDRSEENYVYWEKMAFFKSISVLEQRFWTLRDKLTGWLWKLHSTFHKNVFLKKTSFWKVRATLFEGLLFCFCFWIDIFLDFQGKQLGRVAKFVFEEPRRTFWEKKSFKAETIPVLFGPWVKNVDTSAKNL